MTDNVKVNPSLNNNAVNVATDDIDNVHFPIYKHAFGADGSVTLVDSDNPLPITEGLVGIDSNVDLQAHLMEIIAQQKVMIMHLAFISGKQIDEGDLNV